MEITFKLLLTVAVASLASLQFGYHLAELNAPQAIITCEGLDPSMSDCIPMTAQQVGLINGMNAVGGMIGALFSGKIADRIGRRRVSLLNCVFFVSGSLIMVSAHTVFKFCLGRLLAGIGSGSGIVVTPMYLSEISPLALRGITGTMSQVFVNLGILIAQVLGLFYSNEFEWRTILWAGACFGAFNAIMLPFCVESPKWLAISGMSSEARDSLRQLRPNGSSLDDEIAQWKATGDEREGLLGDSSESDEKVGYVQFLTNPVYRRTLIAVAGVLSIQQFSGINSIVFYGVSILTPIMPAKSRVINCAISLMNTMTTLLVAPALDKYGRRHMLLVSSFGMTVFATLLSISLLSGFTILAGLSSILFVGSFGLGLGAVPFLIVSELAVPQAAGVAQSVGTTCNWISTFIIGYFFPVVQSRLHNASFFVFTLTGILSMIYIKRYIPETKGKASAYQVWQQF